MQNACEVLQDCFLLFIKQYGTPSDDHTRGIKVDTNGNIYLVGQNDIGFDTTFITKYDTEGNELWSQRFGGKDWSIANAIDIDSKGNLWVAGLMSDGLPNTGFVAKYDSNGVLIASTRIPSTSTINGLFIGLNESAYVTGYTGFNEVFVAKVIDTDIAEIQGLVTGVVNKTVTCKDNTTAQTVSISKDGTNLWNCQTAGLLVNRNDKIQQIITGIATLSTPVGGSVTGVKGQQAICQNLTTKQSVIIQLPGTNTWNCQAAGLLVNVKDKIRQTVIGVSS